MEVRIEGNTRAKVKPNCLRNLWTPGTVGQHFSVAWGVLVCQQIVGVVTHYRNLAPMTGSHRIHFSDVTRCLELGRTGAAA